MAMSGIATATTSLPDSSGISMNAQLMSLLAESHAAQGANSKQEIEVNSEKLERLREEVQRAIEEAKEAEEDAGFWGSIADFFGGDLAKVAQAVAAAAAIAATGGAATPFIVAAVACAAAAEIGQAAGLDPKICMALSIASAAFGVCAGGAGTGALSAVGTGATVAAAGSQAVGGGASIAEGEYRADVLRANARAKRADADQAEVQLLIEQMLERLQQLQRESQRSFSGGAQISKDTHRGQDAVLTNFQGVAR
jgi:hypothetical protein